MFTVVTALLGILTAALADPIVVERRLSLETRIQPLQKRDNTCVGSIQGKGFAIQTTSCLASQTCCYGSLNSVVACIPYDAICCDWDTAVGWCPQSLICSSGRYAGTGCGQRVQTTPIFTSLITSTSTPSPSPSQSNSSSSSGSNSLSTGSIVGIAVSITCSVLGLLFGVGFKIWKHKRKERQEREQAAPSSGKSEG